MTAAFYDATLVDGRAVPLGRYLRTVRRLGQVVAIGAGGIVISCGVVAGVTVGAVWTVSSAFNLNPHVRATMSIGPATATSAYPPPRDLRSIAGRIDPLTFEVKWARTMALAATPNGLEADPSQPALAELVPEAAPPPEMSVAAAEPEIPLVEAPASLADPAEATGAITMAELPPAIAIPDSVPPLPKLDTVLVPSLPLPRPYPGKREIVREAHNRAPALPERTPSVPEADGRTAVYDIEAHTVYLPSGERLEAHSGLGDKLDDPRYIRVKNRGPTPPNIYSLTLREQLFHGVEAIRLNPVDEGKMFGRDGMLAHTYMLGPNGQSNGCVSFRDYSRFLHAFKRGEVDRLVVVSSLEGTSWRSVAARGGVSRQYADNDR
jgi:hypothetical protein